MVVGDLRYGKFGLLILRILQNCKIEIHGNVRSDCYNETAPGDCERSCLGAEREKGSGKMAFLEVKNLTRIYGKKENALVALDHVSFAVDKGEFIAVTGASGSGKSTLLHLLGTMDEPQEGEVFFEGEDILKLKEKQKAVFRRRQIGFVFQEYNLVPILNVAENIQMPVRLDGRRMDEEYLQRLIHVLGLEGREKHLPQELSGGQKQRVAIGRALAAHPSLLFADEPTGNLDHQNGLEVMSLLNQAIREFSLTLLVVTHDPTIAAMADRVITLSDGVILSDVKVKHALSSDVKGQGESDE